MDRSNLKNQYDTRYLTNRMARTIGHVKLVKSMVEGGADCTEVLIQLAAVRGQLDSICGNIMGQMLISLPRNTARPATISW